MPQFTPFPLPPPCPVVVTHQDRPDEAAATRRRARTGELVRVAHGRYADAGVWASLRPEQRHHVLIRSLRDRTPPGHAVSHLSAAAVAGVPYLGPWPDRVHLTSVGQDRRTTSATFIVHADLDPPSAGTLRLRSDGLLVTDLVRTAADLAMTLPFLDAVVALDRLLRFGVDRDAVEASIRRRGRRCRSRALRSLAFADAASDSVGESVARVRLDEYGAPKPILQHRFRHTGRPDIVVDFWFPDHGVVIEFDGAVKYRDPEMLDGRTPERAVLDEKDREDTLREFDDLRTVRRIRWWHLWDESAFRAKLRGAGLPMSR